MQERGVGVGYTNQSDALLAGKQAVGLALAQGGIGHASLVLAFCTNRTNFDQFYEGIRSVVGSDAEIVGGGAIGVITLDQLSYKDTPAVVAAFDSRVLSAKTVMVTEVDENPTRAGAILRSQLDLDAAVKAVLLFYESIMVPPSSGSPAIIVPSIDLLNGLVPPGVDTLPIFGAGLMGDYQFCRSKQFCGASVQARAATATVLTGNIEIYSTITHGCSLLDGIYRRITKIDGPILRELDGRPVVEVIDEIYGNQSWQQEQPVATLTIGIPLGERYRDFDEQEYVNRLIVGPLPDRSGVVLFESGPKLGDTIQFLYRDPVKMVNSARMNANALLNSLESQRASPVFAMYLDCGGRAAAVSLTPTEEAAEVQLALKRRQIPLLGLYSGVELAPVRGRTRGLDWTGVLLIVAKRA